MSESLLNITLLPFDTSLNEQIRQSRESFIFRLLYFGTFRNVARAKRVP